MSVQFIIGRSGTGKTKQMLETIKGKVMEKPAGNPIIYLVPEQMTFLSEYTLASDPKLGGIIRAQVYSFTRLAWRVLQETGGMSRRHISSSGLNMLIRKIIEDKKEELKIFAGAAGKNGFISHVESMLTEFKRYCVTPEELAAKQEELERNGGAKALKDKLHDLQAIYSDFEEALIGKYVDSEDYLSLLSEAASASDYIKKAEVYVDGFHSFTPQEYTVLLQLMKQAKKVTIALTTDAPFRLAPPEDTHLFRLTGDTYFNVYNLAIENGIQVEKDMMLTAGKRHKEESLAHLEAYFDRRPPVPFEPSNNLCLIRAASRRAEIEGTAREIRRLAREQGLRFKQMAVLVRNGKDYQQLVETIFRDYEIPFFIDQKRPMMNHPLIELIRATFEVINSNWRYESVFRAVKTDLLFPVDANWQVLREKADRLENYVLAYGVKGDRWTEKEDWSYRRFRGLEQVNKVQTDEEKAMEAELNEVRKLLSEPISRLSRRLKKAKTGKEYGEALYLYLEELRIPEKLETFSMEAESRGDLITAREHNQAWNAVMEMIDQYVEVLGDEKTTLKDFSVIVDAGLEAMEFAIVPPAADQVTVANLELSRLGEIEAAFVIGINDGVLPARQMEAGILADEDRERLLAGGMKLALSSRRKMLDEEFTAYRAFTVSARQLYLSYPIADDEGKTLLPSFFIKRIKELFPAMKEKLLVNEPSELDEGEQLQYVCHPNPTLSYLTSQLQSKRLHYPMYDFWWDVYNFYIDDPKQREKAKQVLSSLFYRNDTEQLDETTSTELYGEEILASVTRMEMFNRCPFSHFAQHGLKLRERDIFRLQAPDIGNLFHGALKWIADEVTRQGLNWAQLSKAQCQKLASEAVKQLAPQLQNQILLSSNRHLYLTRKLEQIIGRASYALSGQAKASGFSPVGLELGFGPGEKLPPLAFTLKNGTKMALAGRIDRVDQAKGEDGIYLRVIDYKSSGRDLDLTEVYYGIALQMLTYLDIVWTYSSELVGTEAHPAGVLYFHVHNPFISSKKLLTLEEIERELFKKFKMSGLILGEEESLQLMDANIGEGASPIIPVSYTKSGKLDKRFSKTADRRVFDGMRQHVRRLYQQSGDEIVSGKVNIDPYQYKDSTPCNFCSYRPVCQFDETLEENNYRLIVPKKDILEDLKEGGS
ncbi:helicase-exonuclease AddAB subunit AddB [Bacillus badius]|uniref:ATP-dependent helicase/deoxyribonuclease subunit B n=1 Tax=Bacillus badius TaxID=1455 RepID=A0ABR5AS79_BACBA|nr:helicase-exonuclease AddAB subunit AddB [Bacillus badius]KIL77614.1 ATP-dependent nuclease, subunit B [Bacillus badius]MED4717777.1 helicase-exonuclease AddAB subunit AddB [Bacillus badius]